MKRVFAAVLVIAMTGGAATAQPVEMAPSFHPVHGALAHRTPVRTGFASVGTDQARGLLIVALLVSATRSR